MMLSSAMEFRSKPKPVAPNSRFSKALTAAKEANNACLVIDGADQIAAAGEYSKGGGNWDDLSVSDGASNTFEDNTFGTEEIGS